MNNNADLLIKSILQSFEPETEEQERLKLYLETHKGTCSDYIERSSKYKERLQYLATMYNCIKIDLLADISREIHKDEIVSDFSH